MADIPILNKKPPKKSATKSAFQVGKNFLGSASKSILGDTSFITKPFQDLKKNLEPLKKMPQSLKSNSKPVSDNKTEQAVNNMRASLVSPINDLKDKTSSMGEMLKGKTFEIVSDTEKMGATTESINQLLRKEDYGINGLFNFYKDKSKIAPKRDAVLKYSPEFVYLADAITQKTVDAEMPEDEGMLSKFLPKNLRNLTAKLGNTVTGLGKGLLNLLGGKSGGVATKIFKAGGLAAFVGTTISDMVGEGGGLEKFKGGDILGGIMTTALGKVADEDSDVWKNMGKQALKWGGLGARLGGPLGGLIGAGIGGIASGVKGAWEMEWDKSAKDTMAEAKSVLQDENATFGKKTLAVLKASGKGLLGTLTGGVRGTVESLKETGSKIKSMWKDEEKSTFSKITGTLWEGIKAPFKAIGAHLKGVFKTAGDFIWNALPSGMKDKLSNAWSGIKEGATKVWEKTKGFFSNIGEGVKGAWNKTKGFFKNIGGGVKNVGKKVGGFFKKIFGKKDNKILEKIDSDIDPEQLAGKLGEIGKKGGLFSKIGGNIKKFLVGENNKGGLISKLAPNVSRVDKFIREVPGLGKIYSKATGFWKKMGSGIGGFFEEVKEKGVVGAIGDRVTNITEKAKEVFQNASEKIKGFFSDVNEKGLFPAIGERLGPLLEKAGEFAKNAAEKIGGFFKDVGKGFGDFVDIAKEQGLGRAAGQLGLSELSKKQLAQLREHFGEEKYAEFISRAKEEVTMETHGLKAAVWSGQKKLLESDFFSEIIKEAGGLEATGIGNKLYDTIQNMGNSEVESVDDAIIKSDGTIIRTSPDDTLIATKNEIGRMTNFLQRQTGQEVQTYMSELTRKDIQMEQELLTRIANAIEQGNQIKPQNNVIQQNFATKYNPTNLIDALKVDVI
ncbi:MAG: phage tail protein [bacterium]